MIVYMALVWLKIGGRGLHGLQTEWSAMEWKGVQEYPYDLQRKEVYHVCNQLTEKREPKFS